MLRNIDYLTSGYILTAEDGDIGRCKDFLFDDRYWTIRYMVADTGKWLPGRKALLAQIAGLAAAPLGSLVGMIGAPGAALARALRAWNEKRGEAPGQEPGAEGAQ